MLSKALRTCAGLVLVAVAAGCSSAASTDTSTTPAGSTGSPGLRIEILNQHTTAGGFTLFIEPVGGVRQSLGVVQPGTSPTFNFAATPGTAYVLLQQTDTGDNRTSDRFNFNGPTTVTWDMNTRRLSVIRR
jgi:hypothetical protein